MASRNALSRALRGEGEFDLLDPSSAAPVAQAPSQSNPWSWGEWAAKQNPGDYGWRAQGALGPDNLAQYRGALDKAGLWKPEWDSQINDPRYSPQGSYSDAGDPTPAELQMDLSSLAGFTPSYGRTAGYTTREALIGPDGRPLSGTEGLDNQYGSGSWKHGDYASALAAMSPALGGLGTMSTAAGGLGMSQAATGAILGGAQGAVGSGGDWKAALAGAAKGGLAGAGLKELSGSVNADAANADAWMYADGTPAADYAWNQATADALLGSDNVYGGSALDELDPMSGFDVPAGAPSLPSDPAQTSGIPDQTVNMSGSRLPVDTTPPFIPSFPADPADYNPTIPEQTVEVPGSRLPPDPMDDPLWAPNPATYAPLPGNPEVSQTFPEQTVEVPGSRLPPDEGRVFTLPHTLPSPPLGSADLAPLPPEPDLVPPGPTPMGLNPAIPKPANNRWMQQALRGLAQAATPGMMGAASMGGPKKDKLEPELSRMINPNYVPPGR